MHTLPQQALQSDSTATEEREKAGSCRKRRETTELGCPSGRAGGRALGPCWLGSRSVHKRSQDTRAYIRSVAPGRPPTRACVAVQDLGWCRGCCNFTRVPVGHLRTSFVITTPPPVSVTWFRPKPKLVGKLALGFTGSHHFLVWSFHMFLGPRLRSL